MINKVQINDKITVTIDLCCPESIVVSTEINNIRFTGVLIKTSVPFPDFGKIKPEYTSFTTERFNSNKSAKSKTKKKNRYYPKTKSKRLKPTKKNNYVKSVESIEKKYGIRPLYVTLNRLSSSISSPAPLSRSIIPTQPSSNKIVMRIFKKDNTYKSEVMDADKCDLKVDDIIWGQLKGHPAWPAKLIARNNGNYTVQWLGDKDRVSLLSPSKVHKFMESFKDNYRSKLSNKNYKGAIDEAFKLSGYSENEQLAFFNAHKSSESPSKLTKQTSNNKKVKLKDGYSPQHNIFDRISTMTTTTPVSMNLDTNPSMSPRNDSVCLDNDFGNENLSDLRLHDEIFILNHSKFNNSPQISDFLDFQDRSQILTSKNTPINDFKTEVMKTLK